MRRSKLTKLVLLTLFLSLIAGALALLLYRRFEPKPEPTQPGWHAFVTTFAGNGAPGLHDGPTSQAQFQDPFGLALDAKGNLYVTDAGDNNRIRKITPDGVVSTLAGGHEGLADGSGTSAAFNTPSGLALDSAGNLYVADTGNNSIRRITPAGVVVTIAGNGTAGYRDGPASEAQFNGPIGVSVDAQNQVYVADTYNDRIRLITPDGQVRTLAGGRAPGYRDGPSQDSLFDTPCGIALTATGDVLIADTGNDRIRRLAKDGQVTTLTFSLPENAEAFRSPVGLVQTHDGFLYVTEEDSGRLIQIAPDGKGYLIAGTGSGFADGEGQGAARFNQPAGVVVDRGGALYVADSANYLLRKVAPAESTGSAATTANAATAKREVLPRLSAQTLMKDGDEFPWPVDPQERAHEVVATMGEVRGQYDGEARHHLHSGIDIQAAYGATVRVVHEEKVTGALSNWGFDSLNEGLRVGLISYVHLFVGRNEKNEPLDDERFIPVRDEPEGTVSRIRIKRGTRFRVGDSLGSINRMYHVHLNFGPPGAEANPLVLPLVGFKDSVPPRIERDGVQLFNQSGERLTEKRNNRLILRGPVRIVVDAYDQVDGNAARRRLGLYKLGYQVLLADGAPAPGFDQPRLTILFDRLPPASDAVKLAYADESGITVYGSQRTRFLYEVTNTVRDGQAASGYWDTSELPAGDYLLRIIASDLAGNEVSAGRDVPVIIER
jgi:sugar lactone lactonase YvrE